MKLWLGNKRYSSWSLRPWLVLKHFGIPFEEEVIGLDLPDTERRLREISPSSRVPVLVDGSRLIWDSLAICEYLAETFPDKRMWPWNAGDRAYARSLAAEMHSGFQALRQKLPMKAHEKFPNFAIPVDAEKDIARIRELFRAALARSGGPYLLGAFSIADAMYAPVAFRFATYNVPLTGPEKDYVTLLLNHPAMKQWKAEAEAEQLRAKRYE